MEDSVETYGVFLEQRFALPQIGVNFLTKWLT